MTSENQESANMPRLRFSEFGGAWVAEKLTKKVTKVGSGVTPKGGADVYQSHGIPLIRSQNVRDNVLDLSEVAYISEEINDSMSASAVQPNDVLLNITGASIGRSCVVPADFAIGNVNQHVCIIRMAQDGHPHFLQTFLASDRGQKLIFQSQSGSGREGLNFENIRTFNVAFPSLPEQKKIAAFLGVVDAKIAALRAKVSGLETYKRGLMQALFSQRLRFTKSDGTAFPDWEEKKLGEVANIFDGTHQTPTYVQKGVRFFSVEQVTANNFEETKFVSESVFEQECKRVRMERSDILMTRIGDIGTARLIDWDVRASFYVSLALIKCKKSINSAYLSHAIMATDFQRELWKRTIHVAFPKKINLGEIGNCITMLPHPDEQQKIADALSGMDAKIQAASAQVSHMETFKKGLLQQMFV